MDYDTTIEIPDSDVKDYVSKNYSVDQVFDDRDIREYVADRFSPADVFTDQELADWAEANGYVSK